MGWDRMELYGAGFMVFLSSWDAIYPVCFSSVLFWYLARMRLFGTGTGKGWAGLVSLLGFASSS